LNQLNIDKTFKNILGSYNFRYDQPRQDLKWTFDDSNILCHFKQKRKNPKERKNNGWNNYCNLVELVNQGCIA